DIGEVLQRLGPETLSVDFADGALPRLSDEMILFRLRGSRAAEAIRATDLEHENTLKRCLLIGAYLTAARWDWGQYMRIAAERLEEDDKGAKAPNEREGGPGLQEDQLKQLKSAMDDDFGNINHRLELLNAPLDLRQDIDTLKQHFAAGRDNIRTLPFREIDESMAAIASQVRVFIAGETNQSLSFALGGWLVWQAELANLCSNASKEDRGYVQSVMNVSFRRANLTQFSVLATEVFDSGKAQQNSREMVDSLQRLTEMFLVGNKDDCQAVHGEIFRLFELLKLEFPSLKSY
ncbi:MAG: hypothetical protein ACE5IY_24190, partial [bacterium]